METARALVARGATVVGTARNLQKAQLATKQVRAQVAFSSRPEIVELDLASLASVRACADSLLNAHKLSNGVIGNAGVMAGPKVITVDGFEAQFARNYLGHFVLINRLAGLLRAGARVAMVSSAGHRCSDVDLNDPNFNQTLYNKFLAYGRSKTATILFAVEFDQRHKMDEIRATAVACTVPVYV